MKKILSAFVFGLIIFLGSQNNIVQAKNIYIGYFDSVDFSSVGSAPMNLGNGYLIDGSVKGNSNTIVCAVCFDGEHNNVWCTFKFVKGLKRWSYNVTISGMGGGFRTGLRNVSNSRFDGKLLNYILDNYE